MHEQNDNQDRGHDARPALPHGGLIRAAADGELTDAEQARLDAIEDADLDRRLAFEGDLRARVSHAMGPVEVPADLRARIAAAMAETDVDDADAETTDSPDVITTPLGETRDPSFWDGTMGVVARWAAVAAVLALAATVIITAGRSAFTSPYSQGQATALVGFIGGEHDRCGEFGSHYDRKMSYQSLEDARAAAARILGTNPDSMDFQSSLEAEGFNFAGLGRCAVPGGGSSIHLMYRRAGDAQPISLFLQTGADRSLDIPDACCLVDGADELIIWQSKGVRYYLFSHDTAAVDAIAGLMAAHTREHDLISQQ